MNRWKFAITAIVETQIKPKMNQFRWDRMKLISKSRKKYTDLYKKKLLGQKLSTKELEEKQV